MINMKSGIHSLTIKNGKVVVESNFGRESLVSVYSLAEYELAVKAFNRLVGAV